MADSNTGKSTKSGSLEMTDKEKEEFREKKEYLKRGNIPEPMKRFIREKFG